MATGWFKTKHKHTWNISRIRHIGIYNSNKGVMVVKTTEIYCYCSCNASKMFERKGEWLSTDFPGKVYAE